MTLTGKILFATVYALVSMGIVMSYSASAVYAEHAYNNYAHFLVRQVIFVMIGTGVLFLTSMMPMRFWKRHARLIMLVSILMLLLVFLPSVGHSAGGARRWINLGVFNFQPVEFAKIAVCLYLADYLSRKQKYIAKGSFFIFMPPLLLVGTVSLLALLQPDLGSCFIVCAISGLLFFLAGIRMRYIVSGIALVVPVFYFLVVRVPYRLSRVTAFLNPWDDPRGSGFQIIQSFLAFGLGGVQGVGLGQSTQKLFYLPSGYNDFIFAIIGEELGLIGILLVLLLFGVVLGCGIRMAERSSEDYEKLAIISLTLLVVLQAVINMLVATGLIPTKGLPLPFVSYGGTSLVFNMMVVGLLLSLDKEMVRRKGSLS